MASPYDRLQYAQAGIVPQYQGAPIKEFANLAEKRELAYNENQETLDLIASSLADTKVLGKDYGIKQEAIDQTKATIQQIVDRGGDYENAGLQVRGLARNVIGNEKLRFANDLYTENTNLQAKYDEMRSNNLLDEAGYQLASASLREDHQGIGEKNEFGTWDKPQYYNPLGKIDIDGEILRRVSAIKAKQATSGWKIDDKYKGALTNWSVSEIKEKEIQDAIDGVLNQGDNRAFLDQRAAYNQKRGSGATTADEIIQEYKNSYQSSAGVFSSKEDIKLIPGTDLNSGRRIVAKEEVEIEPNTFKPSGLTLTTENINAPELVNPVKNRKRMTEIPGERTKTEENIGKATLERDQVQAELDRLTREAEEANEALDPTLVNKMQMQIRDAQTTINLNEEQDNLLGSEYAKLELFHTEALKRAGKNGVPLTEAELHTMTPEIEAEAREVAGIYWDKQYDIENPRKKFLGEEFSISPQDQILKDKFIDNNYPSYSGIEAHQRYNEAMLEITGTYASNMPYYGFTDVEAADDFTGLFMNSLGVQYNGTTKGVELPFAEGEDFPFKFKNYDTHNMEDFDKDDYNNMSTVTVMGTTLRDGDMALVMGLKGKDGKTSYATFGDEAYTNQLLNDNPELIPVFEGLKATTKAREILNTPVGIKPEDLGADLRIKLPYTDPELLGAQPTIEDLQIIPSVTATLDPELNSYLYTITFKGKVLNSDSPRFGQEVDITEVLGKADPRFSNNTHLNQNKIIQYLEAYKNSAN